MSDDEVGSSGSLKGGQGILLASRLFRSMEKHPKEFVQEMQTRMDEHLGPKPGTLTCPRRAEDYCRQVPLERQKVLGYHLWTMAQVYRQLMEGNSELAKLSCLRAIAATEQAVLDGETTAEESQGEVPELSKNYAAILSRS